MTGSDTNTRPDPDPRPDTRPDPGPDRDPRRWWALVVLSIASLLVVLDVSVINVALPRAASDLDIADGDRAWAVTAYSLTFGGLLLLGGRLGDAFGRKRMLLVALAGFAVSSALGGLAWDTPTLIGARSIQGVFAALLAPASLSLVGTTFRVERERIRAFGVFGALQGAGGAVGLVLGGVLTEYASWRWCLLINLPAALLVAALAGPLIQESRPEGDRRLDVPSALSAVAGLAALLLGVHFAGQPSGWTSPASLGLLALGVVLLAVFALVSARSPHPLVPPHVLRDRVRALTLSSSLLAAAGMFGTLLYLTFFLQQVWDLSPLAAGLAFLPFSAGIIATATLGAPLVTRVGPTRVLAAGATLAAAGTAWLVTLDPASTYQRGLLAPLVLTSLGLGAVFLAVPTLALRDLDQRDAGVGSALVNTSQQLGGAFGPALLATLAAGAGAGTGVSYSTTFLSAAALLAAAAVLAILLAATTRHPATTC